MNVVFDNIVNARDLGGMVGAGGKCVRPRRLLRTAHLHDASAADLQRLHEEYNLAKPQEAFLDLERHIVNFSFYSEVQKMAANMYPSLIRSAYSQLQYAAFLRLIVEAPEDGGVLWHCFQGKDRTGWGAAFLLFALGVDREAIVADFDLSNEAYRELVAKLNAQIDAQGGGDKEKEVILAFMGVSTPNFLRTLDLIDNEFGGMIEYLHNQLLLAPDDIQLLRKRFLQ